VPKKTTMMGAEPGRPNELSPITRIDTARVRPVQSAAGRSFIGPGSPWQNPVVESLGSPVPDEVLAAGAFGALPGAQTVITDWRTIHTPRRPHRSPGRRPPAADAASLTTNKPEKPARLS
jgi:transposase InsO family protein